MPTSIIIPGQNAWSIDPAEHLAFLVDGAAYFEELCRCLQKAEREIWIIGWDFDPDICLRPGKDDPCRLADLLQARLDACPDLVIHVLVWALGPVYSGKSLKLFRRKGLLGHERVRVAFDSRHPFWGSHHQKMVAIDGSLAFIGGIDLTARRWDDSRHLPDNPLRVNPDGTSYEPVHDLQVMVDGQAARRISELARRRWRRGTTGDVPAVPTPALAWPDDRDADLAGCRVALSLTEPNARRGRGRRQSGRLLLDAIRAARRSIYIEAQYLASFGVADALAERLAEAEGPEIVIVVTRISHGLIERLVMGNNRDRIIRRLKRADAGDRLWVMYAVVPDAQGEAREILVHSKLVIVDDAFVRVGSSNLNNRSEGLDTEADLSVEACDEREAEAIALLRHRLLAEHMAADVAAVAATYRASGSLLRTIEAHNLGPRGLRHFDIDVTHGETEPVPGTALVDPRRPFRPLGALRRQARRIGLRLFGFFI